ncbi:hypothetical protein [Candidatus Leptofilum sp.]|uniref:hypothetical protein n=1 Tax=Candidatus Leptofilum sp. TaxID=3241576 RepID=UPI003B59E11F
MLWNYAVWRRYGRLCLALLVGLGAVTALGNFVSGYFEQSEAGSGSILYVAPAPVGQDTANTCTDPDNPCATLQHAIDNAVPGDEIRLAEGVFSDLETINGLDQIATIDISLTIRGGYSSTNFVQSFPQTQTTVLDAQMLGRGLVVTGAVTAVIENITIQNGDATGQGGANPGDGCGDAGGGIFVQGATINLTNNIVQSGLACEGGGIYIVDSPQAVLVDNHILQNHAYDVGGGLNIVGGSGAQVLNNIIEQNVAKQNLAASGQKHCGGGSIFNNSDAQIIGNAIFDNSASNNGGGFCLNTAHNALVNNNLIYANFRLPGYEGAGAGLIVQDSDFVQIIGNAIYQNGGADPGNLGTLRGGGLAIGSSDSILIRQNLIYDNTATLGGGAYFSNSNSVELHSNILRQNVALDMPYNDQGIGGGIYAVSSDIESFNSVLLENTADMAAMGTGVYLREATLSLQHPTIAGNDPLAGTAVFISDTLSTLTITNAIVVSQAVGIDASAGGTAVVLDVLWYANGQNTAGSVTVTEEMTADPQFAADGYHLKITSPAINQATPSELTTDVDGGGRPSCTSLPDLGADERHCVHIPIVLRSNKDG